MGIARCWGSGGALIADGATHSARLRILGRAREHQVLNRAILEHGERLWWTVRDDERGVATLAKQIDPAPGLRTLPADGGFREDRLRHALGKRPGHAQNHFKLEPFGIDLHDVRPKAPAAEFVIKG